jgi:hypothetical protein|tara:strand:+ start:299 stop:430 length:132 start_codon:yes stop_codon:yes gene_type:complete
MPRNDIATQPEHPGEIKGSILSPKGAQQNILIYVIKIEDKKFS